MQTEQFQLHADLEQRHWWFVARRRIMRRLVDVVLASAPDDESGAATVVDIGCGTGGNIAALADHYACVGIDTSAEAVDLASRRFPHVEFLTGRAPSDLGTLAARARMFLLMDVLEHVADDRGMLAELLAATSPGSHFLVTVPADPSLWSPHDEAFGHLRRYDPLGFKQVWAGLPVTTLLFSHFNSRLLPLVRLVRWRNRRRQCAAGGAGTDFWLPHPTVNRLLEATLAGESRRLVRALTGRAHSGYRHGASLVAVLRREQGPVERDEVASPALVGCEPS